MSNRAAVFLAEWTRDNMHSGAPFADGAAAREALLAQAHELGMGLAEFEEDAGSLDIFLQRALDEHWGERDRLARESGVADI